MAISDEGEIVVAADDRGLRVFNWKRPRQRWISAKKWIKLEETR